MWVRVATPSVPLFRSPAFADVSLAGLYGDVIEEIDWSVGQVLDTLRRLDLDERTMVAFTSDNGPWLIFNQHGGSAGLLRDGNRVYVAGNNDDSHYFAVAELLWRWGCRWYIPTEFGECIPEESELTVGVAR